MTAEDINDISSIDARKFDGPFSPNYEKFVVGVEGAGALARDWAVENFGIRWVRERS